MAAVLRLVRGPNLLIAAAGVCAGGWIALSRIAFPKELVFGAISGLALGAVGNTWNDIRDVAADRINRPDSRPLVAGQVSRGVADLIVFDGAGLGLVFAGLVSGWLFLAALAALAVMLLYSPLLKPRPLLGNVAVAIVAAGVGLLFVPASLVLPRNAGYGGAYFVIALLAQMAVLVAATWLLLGKVERVSTLLKGAMVIGLAALVAGKVA